MAKTSKEIKSKNTQRTVKKAKTDTLRTVVYHGYEFRVPASWPVYRLDQHPTACVRYDINAVYLGTPGANMQCPATIIGRGLTVSVIPSTTVAAGSGSEVTYQRDQPDAVGGGPVRSLTAVHAKVTEDTAEHRLRVALHAAALGATVLATYGSDPAVVERVLGSLRTAPKGAAPTAQTGSLAALMAPSRTREPAAAQRTVSAVVSARSKATGLPLSYGRPRSGRQRSDRAASVSEQSAAAGKGWPGIPVNWPIHIISPPPPPTPTLRVVSGFDACAAPSLATMRKWRKDYAAVGVYIGGLNRACAWGNLSASWFSAAAAMGWGMLPTYVGLQAPCTSGIGSATINPRRAAAQGRQDGLTAIADAKWFKIGAGAPIYFDMEAYIGDASCHATVLKFLGAWDRTVAGAGYKTGVYSSTASAIADVQAATIAKTPGFTAPDAIWIAQWDHVRSLDNGQLDSLSWPLADRAKQYQGIVSRTIGGAKLDIDLDLVGSPLAH